MPLRIGPACLVGPPFIKNQIDPGMSRGLLASNFTVFDSYPTHFVATLNRIPLPDFLTRSAQSVESESTKCIRERVAVKSAIRIGGATKRSVGYSILKFLPCIILAAPVPCLPHHPVPKIILPYTHEKTKFAPESRPFSSICAFAYIYYLNASFFRQPVLLLYIRF